MNFEIFNSQSLQFQNHTVCSAGGRVRAVGSTYFVTTDFNPLRLMPTKKESAVGTIHIYAKIYLLTWEEKTLSLK